MSRIRTYSELITFNTFEERFNYLKVPAPIGADTFGANRYVNQAFYRSPEWKRTVRDVIIRDNACDLGVPGFEIIRAEGDRSKDNVIIVHHMNPITLEQILERDPDIFNPEYLITTKMLTHNLLHYGAANNMPPHRIIVRSSRDTTLW